MFLVFLSSRRRHTRCALVTGVQTCALPISLDPTESVGRFRAPSNAAERSRGRTVEGTGVRRDDSVPIYTIGHSTRTIDQFVEMLRAAQVTELVDVSSIPRSRPNPQYNRSEKTTYEHQSILRTSHAVS